MICNFQGEYKWLSNFYGGGFVHPYTVNGVSTNIYYATNEHFYQAYKAMDNETFLSIVTASTPVIAKMLGNKCKLRPDWNDVKVDVMRTGIRAKFTQNEESKLKLLATKDEVLIEGNDWGDTFWGVCNCHGLNWLGILLMEIRTELSNA